MTTTPVNRLKNTWAGVPPEAVAYFEDCRNLMEKNFARLRLELDTATPPAIPYLGAYQRDLVYLDESPTMKGESGKEKKRALFFCLLASHKISSEREQAQVHQPGAAQLPGVPGQPLLVSGDPGHSETGD